MYKQDCFGVDILSEGDTKLRASLEEIMAIKISLIFCISLCMKQISVYNDRPHSG
jgi:hypothetical protein